MLSGKERGLRRLVRWSCVHLLVGRRHRAEFQGLKTDREYEEWSRVQSDGLFFFLSPCGLQDVAPGKCGTSVDASYVCGSDRVGSINTQIISQSKSTSFSV
jgi:hypothetical protein